MIPNSTCSPSCGKALSTMMSRSRSAPCTVIGTVELSSAAMPSMMSSAASVAVVASVLPAVPAPTAALISSNRID